LAAAAAAALLAVAAAVPPRACQPPYNSLPFCNVSLPIAQRVADLLSRLTVQQKVAQTDNTAAAIPSLGIPEYQWWSEALHGVNANCVNGHCPTSFPCALVMGASFDMPLVDSVATAISDEARAMNSAGAKTFLNDYFGLDVWAPNLNVFRDPRWGRGQEVPGECPYLVGQYGAHFVSNLEGAGQSSRYLKLAATMKHFTAYDLEHWEGYDRESFNAIVSQLDLVQTFYPPFQRTVQSGGVHGVMCSYNAVNGVPSCANPFLSQVVRQQWGFQGYITSDCDAIYDICYAHNYTSTPEQAVADALSAGCDLDCGNTYGDHLISALQQGLVNISYLDASLTRLFTLRMQLGLFDPVAGQPYTNYTLDVVDSAQHRALARQAAREGITLLKNQPAAGDAAPLLPLRAPLRIALIGPNANVTDTLCSNYYGELPHVVSVLEGLSAVAGASVTFVHGCDINSTDTSGFPAAVAAAAAADVAVLVLGLDQTIEREGLDRITISLPGVQEQLAQAVFAKQPRTVLVLVNGGPVAIEWEAAELPAIVEAYYPGEEGGNAIADILFGL
jgi:pre-mRNA-splicing factor SYF2/beta-D-xylosidase 4